MNAARARIRRAGVVATLALTTTLAVAGCSGAAPGVAAVSDGQRVTESQIDDVVADFGRVQGAQAPTRAQIASGLALRPYFLDAFKGTGKIVSEQAIQTQIATQLPNASNTTLQYLQLSNLQQGMDQATSTKLTKLVEGADIQLNPRYGEWKPGKGFEPPAENWIVSSPTAAPTAPQG